jgi:diguanylate cyclase (GGDEF)-like protein/PAS domain S-box-containing protein
MVTGEGTVSELISMPAMGMGLRPTSSDRGVHEALFHAAGAAADPVIVVAGERSALRVSWANRAFADAVCAEVSDLADASLESVLISAAGGLPLNDLRRCEFRATLSPRVGYASSWDAVAVPSVTADGRCWVVTLRRSGDSLNADQLLRAAEERFRALSERAPIGIFTSEVGLRIGYINDFLAELVGIPTEQLLGTGWMQVVDPEHLDVVCACLQDALAGEAVETPARLLTVTGDERWVTIRAVPIHAPDSPAAFLGTVEDVTERRHFEQILSWQASHDPLTRLPNRARLIEEIDEALAAGGNDVAVMFVDLDDFKAVNDTLGHASGDELLVEVATRLSAATVDTGQAFRFAGDEFVVLAQGIKNDDEAIAIGERLRLLLAEPIALSTGPRIVTCSVGVARAIADDTVDRLLHDADVAMYQAKRGGKGATAVLPRAGVLAGDAGPDGAAPGEGDA